MWLKSKKQNKRSAVCVKIIANLGICQKSLVKFHGKYVLFSVVQWMIISFVSMSNQYLTWELSMLYYKTGSQYIICKFPRIVIIRTGLLRLCRFGCVYAYISVCVCEHMPK